jgi:hypothetical protein
MCLPLAVANLKKRQLPRELVLSCVKQLCKSGCYELARELVTKNADVVAPSLALLVDMYAMRWP